MSNLGEGKKGDQRKTEFCMTTSIIIPVYNVEEFLPECLDSILIDNHYDGEVICVNDGSTDGSSLILNQYANKYQNIRIITQSNKGLSEARNAGLREASGDYVFFIDSDDWIFPNVLHTIIDKISSEDVVYFNSIIFQEETNQLLAPYEIAEHNHIDGQKYFATARIEKRNTPCVCVWSGVYNRRFLISNHLWNEPGIYHEDNYFTPKVLAIAKDVSCLNEYVYAYRCRTDGSITASCKPKHIQDLLFIARQLHKQFIRNKKINPTFIHYIADLYTDLLCRAYDNHLPLEKWWGLLDGLRYYRCQGDPRLRKASTLSIISPKLTYKYLTDRLPDLCRRFVNIVL